jgi:hypothetical protein
MTKLLRVTITLACLSVGVGCSADALRSTSSTGSTTQRAENARIVPSPRSTAEIAAAVRRDIFWLAADARQGRGVGTEGLASAGDYIADRFDHFGLKPLPGLNGYFQPFDYDVGGKVGPQTTLSVNGVGIAGDQFTGLAKSKAGEVEGKLAFVGYGAKRSDKTYDDFADIDIKDRVVMIMRWEPVDENGKSLWESEGFSSAAAIQRKITNAINAGAKAVILVNAPTHHDDAEKLMDPQAGIRRAAMVPVFHVTIDAANQILAAAGSPPLAERQAKIDSTQKPDSVLLDSVTLSAKLQIEKDSTSVRNVVAYLPGKGPHANEYVVIGAHYDHVGLGNYGSRAGSGEIHNGADDNASGTTTLLALAENFALAGEQDRSIVFVAFTLEELGLIGSRKFADSNVIPIESVAAMLNLDMVGRMKDEHLYVGGGGTAANFEELLASADEQSPILIRSMGKGGRGPSDHQSFSAKGVPVLFFFSGMHPDYHAPGDDPEKINYQGIANVVDLSFNLVQRLCQMPRQEYIAKYDGQQPDVNVVAGGEPGKRAENREMIEPDRPRLGIVPDYTTEPRTDGVLISGVTDHTAAQDAGLKAGDVITQLNDRKIASLEDVMEFINGSKIGDKVAITVLRDGQSVTMESIMKGRPTSN